MKKFLSVVICFITLLGVLSVYTSAENADTTEVIVSQTVQKLDDGGFIKIIVTEDITSRARATTSKTGSKYFVLTDDDGNELFRFTIKATFSVNTGVSATCTSVSYTYNITDNAWDFDSATTSKSGNKATATGTFKKKVLFITTDTRSCTVTLQCDKNGNLS